MVPDEPLRRYRNAQFTDDDVTACTGLSARAWRELIKIRAVRTITENVGRGNVRLCDHMVFKRGAVIGALNKSGLSLAVSGHIAYSLPFHTLLYEICDPCAILLDRSARLDIQTGLPPRLKKPKADWFWPDKPAEADPESDWLLKIYERRFVGVVYNAKDEAMTFGDLRDNGTRFVAWWPLPRRVPRMGRVIEAFVTPKLLAFCAEWENPTKWPEELKNLGYKYENHDRDDDPLCIAAQEYSRDCIVTTTINVTMSIRKALRRYLGIERTGPSIDM